MFYLYSTKNPIDIFLVCNYLFLKWDVQDSNLRPLPCQGNALNQLS